MSFSWALTRTGARSTPWRSSTRSALPRTSSSHWDLQAVSKYAREACEFVNLYSQVARHQPLAGAGDGLRPAGRAARGAATQGPYPEARQDSRVHEVGLPLSNDRWPTRGQQTRDPELIKALAWSKAVNATIADMVHGVPPFPYVRESLRPDRPEPISSSSRRRRPRRWCASGKSTTSIACEHYQRSAVIAGQEMGTKSEHIRFAAQGKYADDHKLMIGDAPGDLKAARDNNALFFPINPGREDESWQRFYQEGLARFFDGTYAGAYEASLVAEFDQLLPDAPPWKRK